MIGNSNTNLVNDGIIVRQGDWIYYSGFPYAAFYKIKVDGTQRTKISSSIGGYLNIVGDWIYFCSATGGKRGGVKKMKLDGTQETAVGDVKKAVYLNIIGDWIYYKRSEEESDYLIGNDGKLCKMRLDGTGNTQLTDDNTGTVAVVGDWIYYENRSDQEQLYRIKTDGTGKVKVHDLFKRRDLSDFRGALRFNIVEDNLYYSGSEPGRPAYIFKIKTDGTGEVKIGSDGAGTLSVDGGWIYYANLSDGNKLYKIKTDGSQKTKLSNDRPFSIFVLGDWLFAYVEGSKTDNLIMIKTDGTGRRELK